MIYRLLEQPVCGLMSVIEREQEVSKIELILGTQSSNMEDGSDASSSMSGQVGMS